MLKRVLPGRLKALRELRNITQAWLAQGAQVAPAVVVDLETGCGNPKTETLVKVSGFLGVSPNYLLGYDSVLAAGYDGPLICGICGGLVGSKMHGQGICIALQYAKGVDAEILSRVYGITLRQVFDEILAGKEAMKMRW
jgi:DNA-binding XRE family transcriptional regulator